MELWVEGFQLPAEDLVKDDLPAVIREQDQVCRLPDMFLECVVIVMSESFGVESVEDVLEHLRVCAGAVDAVVHDVSDDAADHACLQRVLGVFDQRFDFGDQGFCDRVALMFQGFIRVFVS